MAASPLRLHGRTEPVALDGASSARPGRRSRVLAPPQRPRCGNGLDPAHQRRPRSIAAGSDRQLRPPATQLASAPAAAASGCRDADGAMQSCA